MLRNTTFGLMAFFILSFLILINNFSWSNEASINELMSQYETLQPFHEKIAILMPDEKCSKNKGKGKGNKEHCWIDRQWEDNSKPFEDLLQKTENSVDTTNPNFAHTPLGQKYQQLKTFMSMHNRLKSCSSLNSVASDDILHRAQSNISLALENPDDCKPVSSNSESISLLGKHLQQVARSNTSIESSFENDLFSKALQTSIQTRITFTKQFGNDDINTLSFKQKLLDQFCKGNIPTPTSRGLRQKQGQACTEKDEKVISDLIRQTIDETNNKELIQHSTRVSHQEEQCSTIQRKKKCVVTNVYEFQSTPPKFAGENQIDSLDAPTIVADINYRIANLNSILEDYNEQRKDLEEKWTLENQNLRKREGLNLPERRKADHEYSLKRKKFEDELKRLKKTVFLEYKQELALLHASGAGSLLQTKSVRNQSNFKELERIASKALGILGFEEAELTHPEEFPLLKLIDDYTAHLAKQEALSRIDQQIQTLLTDQRDKHNIDQEYLDRIQQASSEKEKQDLQEWYQDQRFDRLSKLILLNPKTTSSTLLNNPEYSSILCKTIHKIEKNKEFKDMLKTALFIGSASGSVAIAILTAGIGVPAPLTIASAVIVGTGLTLTDFTLRVFESNRHSRNQENLLNTYLSQTGDDQSIEDIRTEWKSSIKEQYHAGWALALGTFDISRIGSAVKKIKLHKNSSANIPTLQTQNNQLQRIITENDQYKEAIESLLQQHSIRSVQRLLHNVRRLPVDQQKTVLDSFSRIAHHNSFDLTAFSREIKQTHTVKNIKELLKRWAICISCRIKVGTKKTKNSSDSKSIIESTK